MKVKDEEIKSLVKETDHLKQTIKECLSRKCSVCPQIRNDKDQETKRLKDIITDLEANNDKLEAKVANLEVEVKRLSEENASLQK